jgi:hypothetical protein
MGASHRPTNPCRARSATHHNAHAPADAGSDVGLMPLGRAVAALGAYGHVHATARSAYALTTPDSTPIRRHSSVTPTAISRSRQSCSTRISW